jgi:hypothetical protein
VTPAPERLDQTQVVAALAAVMRAAPDLTPVHHCNGMELDLEVPDEATAGRLTRLLDDIRTVPGTQLYDRGYGGTIASCPVRVLITRTRRGQVWAA